MGRGVALSIEEQAKILAFHRVKMRVADIARETGRSPSAVTAVIRRGKVRRRERKRGPRRKIRGAAVRALIRAARTGRYTARDLQRAHASDLSVRRVQQLLKADPDLVYRKGEVAPRLLPQHREKRREWATEMLLRGPRPWRKTIFSDEKRFCLDGPDGLSARWTDARVGKRWFGKRQASGGGLMVWGCFSRRGKGELQFVEGTINSAAYTSTLAAGLMPFMDEKHPNGCIFQQDNAPCHKSNYTLEWMAANGIVTMDWPARSPDMNPIENLWGLMARDVYRHDRVFENTEELRGAIIRAWEKIPMSHLQALADSMPSRTMELKERKGGETHY